MVLNSVLKVSLVNAHVTFRATEQNLSVIRVLRSNAVVGILCYSFTLSLQSGTSLQNQGKL